MYRGTSAGHAHWKSNVEAYRWALQELNESLSRQETTVLDPYTYGSLRRRNF